MPKKTKKQSTDLNVLAAQIIEAATEPAKETTGRKYQPQKNPAAVALGRLGGLKGGKARAERLSARRRHQIAKKAARARWK